MSNKERNRINAILSYALLTLISTGKSLSVSYDFPLHGPITIVIELP
jgi:hypothetical protein